MDIWWYNHSIYIMDMVILYCLSILNKFNNTLVSDLCLWLWSGSLEWEDQLHLVGKGGPIGSRQIWSSVWIQSSTTLPEWNRMRLGTEICRSWVAEYTLLIPAVSMMCIPQKILNHVHFIHNLTHPRCWNRWLGVYWAPKKMPPDWSTHVWFEHVKPFYQIITWKIHDVTHFIQLVTYRVAIIRMDRP
jgi:hypothetical protein